MGDAGMHAGGKGVQPANAVGKAILDQEIQRAICDGWLMAKTVGGKTFKHLVSAHGAMRLQQDLKRSAAHRGQPHAAFSRHICRPRKRVALTMAMVMSAKCQIRILWFGRCRFGFHVTLSHSS